MLFILLLRADERYTRGLVGTREVIICIPTQRAGTRENNI